MGSGGHGRRAYILEVGERVVGGYVGYFDVRVEVDDSLALLGRGARYGIPFARGACREDAPCRAWTGAVDGVGRPAGIPRRRGSSAPSRFWTLPDMLARG